MMDPEVGITTATKATKDIKRYLKALSDEKCGISRSDVVSTIQQILKKSSTEEKHLIQLQLFLHLPYPELKKVQDKPGDFVFLAPPMEFTGLVPQDYCRLIISGEMVHHFMQMVLVLRNQAFIQGLVLDVIDLVLKEDICKKFCPYVLIMLGKICRLHEAENDNLQPGVREFFVKTFTKFLNDILYLKTIPQSEQLALLLRLVGISCMKKSDYKMTGSELIELIEEWSYDLTNRIAQKTSVYFEDLFRVRHNPNDSIPSRIVLLVCEKALKQLQETGDEDSFKTPKTSKITWLEYIGVHAYLTKSILEVYSPELDPEVFSSLLSQTSKWAEHKPKLTREDFQGEIGDFDHFVEVMKRFGDKARDRQVLLKRFLEFSYSEVFSTKDGLKIADKYLVPGADYETALEYIKKAMCYGSNTERSIPEKIKVVILRLMLCNPEVKTKKGEIVAEVFKNGASSRFALTNFAMDINQVCSQIGSFEKETKDDNQIQHNEDIVYHVCLQNPMEAVTRLIKHSFRSHHFKVLCLAKPFLKLASGPVATHPPSVMNSCFQRLLQATDEPNAFFECIVTSIPKIIANDLMSASEIYHILKKIITEVMTSKNVLLGKVSQLLSMLDSLTCSDGIDRELMKEMHSFTLGMITFSNIYVNIVTGPKMMEIRRKCLILKNKLLEKISDQPLQLSEKPEEVKKLNELSQYELGLLYIRNPPMRENITVFLNIYTKDYRMSYEKIQSNIINWVLNSEPEIEWKATMDFILKVLFPSDDELKQLNPVRLFNDCLHGASKVSVMKNYPTIIRQFLKFYKKCIQYCWEQKDFTKNDQVLIIETFVMLSKKMFQTMKSQKSSKQRDADDTSIQQVLLLLLEILNWVVGNNADFEETLRDTLLDIVTLLPLVQGKCEPIRRCIIDRVVKPNTRMIPLPGTSSISSQQINDRIVAEMDDLVLINGTHPPTA